MKPAHLQQHHSTKPSGRVGKAEEFYKQKLLEFKLGQTVMMKATCVSSKTLEESYAILLLVAKSKKPHSRAEDLILPAAKTMAEIIIDKKAAGALMRIPLSSNTGARINDTVCRVILLDKR